MRFPSAGVTMRFPSAGLTMQFPSAGVTMRFPSAGLNSFRLFTSFNGFSSFGNSNLNIHASFQVLTVFQTLEITIFNKLTEWKDKKELN